MYHDEECDVEYDVKQISKLLRRLKIHFPTYGEGYLYLLLREFNFDCCDAIEALRDKALPECLEDVSTALTIEEVQDEVVFDHGEGNIRNQERSQRNHPRQDVSRQCTSNKQTKYRKQKALNESAISWSDNEKEKDAAELKHWDEKTIPECESGEDDSNGNNNISERVTGRSTLSYRQARVETSPFSTTDEPDEGSPQVTSTALRHSRRRQIVSSDSETSPTKNYIIESISSDSDDHEICQRTEKLVEGQGESERSSPRLLRTPTDVFPEPNASVDPPPSCRAGAVLPSLFSRDSTPVESELRKSSLEDSEFHDAEDEDKFEEASDGDHDNALTPKPKPLHHRVSLFSDSSVARSENPCSPSGLTPQSRFTDTPQNSLFSVSSPLGVEDQEDRVLPIKQKQPVTTSGWVPQPSDCPAGVSAPAYPILPKPPQHGRRGIRLLDTPPVMRPAEYTKDQLVSGRDSTNFFVRKALDSQTTSRVSISSNENSDDDEPSRRHRVSVDLLNLMKARKLQSQLSQPTHDSGPSPAETETTFASAYVHALDGYLRTEAAWIARTKREDHLPLDMRGESLPTDPPKPEAAGFRWWPQKRRYFRPSICTKFFRPRHRFLLGPTVYGQLYDYQKTAVAWMFELFKQRAGGILADEMGLGKTVQVAAFLRGLYSSELATHILIVLPLTLIAQWKSHLQQWCPKMDVAVFHGTKAERRMALQVCTQASTACALLTTYETFRNSCAELTRVRMGTACQRPRTELEAAAKKEPQEGPDDSVSELEWREHLTHELDETSRPWDVVVLDEAHKIKNARNQSAQAIRLVEAHCRILLTGTPLTNSLDDLWSLMDFTCPGLLGNHRTFKAEFSDPIKTGSARGAPVIAVERKNQISLELQRLIQPYVLRRTVKETLHSHELKEGDEQSARSPNVNDCDISSSTPCMSLPKKRDVVVWIELTPTQETILASRQVRDILRNSGHNQRGLNSMRAVAILLKVCRHPVLLLPPELQHWRELRDVKTSPLCSQSRCDSDEEPDPSYHNEEPWFRTLVTINQVDPEALREVSGKLQFLFAILPAMERSGHRCLLFSQSTKMLDLIETAVMEPLGLSYLRLDGSIPQEERQLRLKKFQRSRDILAMLMTTKVGGQGLNLTCADRVVVVDPDWTPANDNQAVARVHRLGQTKDVIVYRLFTSGAIEDHAFRLQTFKQGITKAALETANQKTYFSENDMRQIFTLRPRGASETLRILDSVDPEQKKRRHELMACVKEDFGEVCDSVFKFVGGLSDFDELHRELSKASSLHVTKETEASVKSSLQKLRGEAYDETQLLNVGFIQKAKEKLVKQGELW